MVQKEEIKPLSSRDYTQELSLAQGKIPPNAVDVERLVLGAFLVDRKGIDESIDLITPEVFYDPRHQIIFSAITKLYHNTQPVDLMTVIQELKKEEKLNIAGGDQYKIGRAHV